MKLLIKLLLFLGIASSGIVFLIHSLKKFIVGLQSYTVPTYTPAPKPINICHIYTLLKY